MPEPLLYLKATAAAAIVSTVWLLLAARRMTNPMWTAAMCLGAIAAGLVAGYYALSLRVAWPPANGLDRLLAIVLPLTLAIELLAGVGRLPRWCAWLLRIAVAMAIPRILLHGSVYLSDTDSDWSMGQALATLLLCSGLLVIVWWSLVGLSHRSSALSVIGALVITTLCAGITVMVAGYLKGGAAALPLAASLAAASLTYTWVRKRAASDACDLKAIGGTSILGVGIVGLFGLLFIGHFFGQLSASSGLVMLFAPLLCWLTELPGLRTRPAWLVGTLRLVLVAIPLTVLLVLAKQEFDRELAPLL